MLFLCQRKGGARKRASRIQGITVEIGGDTTKLSTALFGVNKEIKGTQTQLKDVEKLLKLDPTNVTLLAQKQKLLTQEIEATGVLAAGVKKELSSEVGFRGIAKKVCIFVLVGEKRFIINTEKVSEIF